MTFEELIRSYSRPMTPIATPLQPKGSPTHSVKAVLFDVYGTLFISKAGDIGGARSEASLRLSEIDNLCKRFELSYSAEGLVERFFDSIEAEKLRLSESGIDYPEVVIEDIWERVTGIKDRRRIREIALEFELIVNPVYPMPGLGEVLSTLKRRGVLMGIISNAQFYTPYLFSSYLGMALDEIGFSRDLIFFSYELGYVKPSIRSFSLAAERLLDRGVEAKNTLYVGNDMLKDVYPAKAVGFQAALFAGDARSLKLREEDERFRSVEPDIIINDLKQLPDFV